MNMEKLTQEHAIIISGFTQALCVSSFGDFHADVEKRLGRPIFTHQSPSFADEIKAAYKDDFLSIFV
jgi:hypothetical protein